MREYIVNLTNNLIGEHGFDLIFESMKSRDETPEYKEAFTKLVRDMIGSRNVRVMSPETLGKIMCSFENYEIPAINLPNFGDTDQFLRDTVAMFLAYSIRYRLEVTHGSNHGRVPSYIRKEAAHPSINS